MNWKKIIADVLKAAIGALIAGLGFTVTGCQIIPIFEV